MAALFLIANLIGSGTALAQRVRHAALFVAGGALGLAAHESGHVIGDAAFGAAPGFRTVHFGPLPFFAITHRPVSPVREFAISSAGFWVQHALSELIFSTRPQLRHEQAPLVKGVLAFNVLTSMAYAGAAFATSGPDERDTRGIAVTARIAEPWIGAMILVPAAFDAVRYYQPEAGWVRWGSRAAKIGGALLIVRAAR